jgi:hypothetical protein
MTTFFIGEILEVKSAEREDKKTRKTVYFTEVTVMCTAYDEGGYLAPSLERIQISEHWYDALKDKIRKFIAVPYRTIHTQNGTYTFPDGEIAPVVLDKNPVDYTSFKRAETAKKVS